MSVDKISVIIPVYNSEQFLVQCLESVVGQVYRELEIICIDDGSTDGSLEILNCFQQREQRIKVVCQLNRGVSVARNRGLELASGDFCYFLDSDDFLEPTALGKMVHRAKLDESDLVLVDYYKFVNSDKKSIERMYSLCPTRKEPIILHTAWSYLFRRALITPFPEAKFPENISQGEDSVFSLLLMFLAARFSYIHEPLINYRQHENMVSRLKNDHEQQAYVTSSIAAFEYVKNFWLKYPKLTKSQANKERFIAYFDGLSSQIEKYQGSSHCLKLPKSLLLYQKIVKPLSQFFFKQKVSNNKLSVKICRITLFKRRIRSGKKVSIVIPVYNKEKYVAATLESALQQTYRPIEIVCVDDGSTDNSLAVIKRYANNFSEISVLKLSVNTGVSFARNHGIRNCSGSYILPLDADDLIDSNYCKKAVEILDRDRKKCIGVVYCEAKLFDDNGEKDWELGTYKKEKMLRHNQVFNCALFRRVDWERFGGYNEHLVDGLEDWDFWLNFTENDLIFYKIPNVLFFYRQVVGGKNDIYCQKLEAVKSQVRNNHPLLFKGFDLSGLKMRKRFWGIPGVIELRKQKNSQVTRYRIKLLGWTVYSYVRTKNSRADS